MKRRRSFMGIVVRCLLSAVLAIATEVDELCPVPAEPLRPLLEVSPFQDNISRRLDAIPTTDELSKFRAIPKKGLRGFLEGGVFASSTASSCAGHCVADPLCLSFDYETISLNCYISHTDRYANPQAFLNFPTGVYYEWRGVVDSPEFEPNGGQFSTQAAVRLLTGKLGATIKYRVILTSNIDGNDSSANYLFGVNQSYSTAASGDMIILPRYSCKLFAIAVKEGMNDSSLVISNEYKIFASKYVYLVPYFNGNFHGQVVRVQVDIRGKKRPRPALYLEFSDYETPNGIGPYTSQISMINLATGDSELKGFHSGFTALSPVTFVNESFLVPAPDDPKYQVTAWRVVLKEQYTPSPTHSGFGSPGEFDQDSEYVYLVPFFNGSTYPSKVVRVLASTFNTTTPIIETLNFTTANNTLGGFASSFTDGTYGYLVPKENKNGLFGKLVRFSVDNFTADSVEVLDLAAINPRFVGFSSAITYADSAYLVPFQRPLQGDELTTNLREFPVSNSGLVVRVNLTSFSVDGSLDLASFHPDLCGFSSAVTVTNFAYFIPYMRVKQPASQELNPYSGLVAQVDLRDFATVKYLDLTAIDAGLRGFKKGFVFQQYVFLVPHRFEFYNPYNVTQSGKVARIDTTDFSPSGVSFLDLTTALRSQVPDFADQDLRGFSSGVVSGKYGFFVPYFNGAIFSGKVCRISLDKFNEVQILDLTQLNSSLTGFADGIVSKVQDTLDADLFNEFKARTGTTDPYEYSY